MAGNARKETEKEIGKSVICEDNFLEKRVDEDTKELAGMKFNDKW